MGRRMRRFSGKALALFSVLAFGLSAFTSPQQELESVQFTVQVVNERVTVGDTIEIRVRAANDAPLELMAPESSINLGDFEFLDARIEEGKESSDTQAPETLVILVTTFKTGELEIPSIPVTYSVRGTDEVRTGSTGPIPIQIESVLPKDAQDILDIKPPLEIPKDWLPVILLSALIAALAAAAFLLLRRHLGNRQTGRQPAPPKPARPPHLTAYEALEQLRKSQLLERGQLTRFYVRVSEIIRRYFEERFGVEALEMSTPEVLKDLAATGQDTQMPLFQEFLDRCDLVKFAKYVPLREQSDHVFELAFQIVDSTRETAIDKGDRQPEEGVRG